MSLCIGIREDELREVAGQIDKDKFKFKFLYNSENHEEFHKQLGIQELRDNVIFSGNVHKLHNLNKKIKGQDENTNMMILLNSLFESERHLSIVNDFYDHQYIVLVFSSLHKDPAEMEDKERKVTLGEETLNRLMELFLNKLSDEEGIPTTTWDMYRNGTVKDDEYNMDDFIAKQLRIKDRKKKDYQRQIIRHFEESYKFRLISIYTKLRDYGLEDIMRKLDEFGYLDDRFKEDVFIYEEEARRLLARRLCTMSFKNDIEILINKGIYSEDSIKYTF